MQTWRQGSWSERANRLFPQGSNGEYDFPDGLAPVFERASPYPLELATRSVDYDMGLGVVGRRALGQAVTSNWPGSRRRVDAAGGLGLSTTSSRGWRRSVRGDRHEATMTAIRIAGARRSKI
jgi:hypothetical protein